MKKLLLLVALASFTMNAQTILFEDDFESYSVTDNVGEDTDIPATYVSYDVDGDTYNWGLAIGTSFTQPLGDLYTGNFLLSASYITTGAGGNGGQGALSPNNIIVLPMVSIPSGATNVELIYLVGSATDPNFFSETYSVQVTESSDQAAILAATPILETTLSFQGSDVITLSLDAFAGQDVYVSFRHYDTTDQWLLGLDDVKIQYDSGASVEDLQAQGFSYHPNPVSNVLNLQAHVAISNVNIYNILGQEVLAVTPSQTQSEIDFSSLKAGVYLVKVQIGNTEGTFKIVKQ